MLLVWDRFLIVKKWKLSRLKLAQFCRLYRCIPVMSHDNDNARNFAAAAACGTAVVTPLISTWPTSASHTWLDWTQSKNRNKGRYTWLRCRFENNARRRSRRRRRRLPFMIKGAHLSKSYLVTVHVINVLSHDYAKDSKFDILYSSSSLGLRARLWSRPRARSHRHPLLSLQGKLGGGYIGMLLLLRRSKPRQYWPVELCLDWRIDTVQDQWMELLQVRRSKPRQDWPVELCLDWWMLNMNDGQIQTEM